MPVVNSSEDDDLESLVMIHGLATVEDKVFAIEGIALDLGIPPIEAQELLIAEGYLQERFIS